MKNTTKKIIIAVLLIFIILVTIALIFTIIHQKTTDNTPTAKQEIKVVDAVNFTKTVNFVYPEYNVGNDIEHSVIIPKLEAGNETDSVKAFNDKIYACFSDVYEKLKSNSEGDMIYDIKYKSKCCNNVIGIIVIKISGAQNSEYSPSLYYYYYDITADKEISQDEYLSALGTDKSTVFDKFKQTPEYIQMNSDGISAEATVFDGCILDESSAIIGIFNDTFPISPVEYYEYDYSFIK